MANQFIKTESRKGVFILTMHDPPTRNALGSDMAREMTEALDRFEDDPEGRVLLLTGTEPSFCSGANVRGFNQRIEDREERSAQAGEPSPLPWGKMESRFARRRGLEGGAASIPLRLNELQKPSIAAVNGHAMGVGMGVALACDIRIAAEKAQFSEAFVRMGLIPGDGSCWQLPRLIGLTRIHRKTTLGTVLEEARGCSSESGIMVLEQKTAWKQGAPNRCCHRTIPTGPASSLMTTAWWPMPACSCRPPWPSTWA